MQAFIIDLENRPGEFANVAEKLAAKDINLLACGIAANGHGYVGVVGSDDTLTRRTLDEIHCTYRELEILPVTLEHVPGTIAKLSRTLAKAGVNLEFFMPTGESGGRIIGALGVDRVEDARRILGNQVTNTYGSLWPKAMAHTPTS